MKDETIGLKLSQKVNCGGHFERGKRNLCHLSFYPVIAEIFQSCLFSCALFVFSCISRFCHPFCTESVICVTRSVTHYVTVRTSCDLWRSKSIRQWPVLNLASLLPSLRSNTSSGPRLPGRLKLVAKNPVTNYSEAMFGVSSVRSVVDKG